MRTVLDRKAFEGDQVVRPDDAPRRPWWRNLCAASAKPAAGRTAEGRFAGEREWKGTGPATVARRLLAVLNRKSRCYESVAVSAPENRGMHLIGQPCATPADRCNLVPHISQAGIPGRRIGFRCSGRIWMGESAASGRARPAGFSTRPTVPGFRSFMA